MRRRRKHPPERRQPFAHKAGNILQIPPIHKHQQIVGPRHQVAALNLLKTTHPKGHPIETTLSLRTDSQFNHCPNRIPIHMLRVQNRTPSQ